MSRLRRWSLKRVWMLGSALLLIVNASILQTFGAACTDGCTQNTLCNGATVQCVYCDAGAGISCSDYQAVEYANNVTKRIAGTQTANSQGSVWCMKVWQCQDGSTSYGFVCAAGNFCGGPFPFYCIVCARAATSTGANATHYICINCKEE